MAKAGKRKDVFLVTRSILSMSQTSLTDRSSVVEMITKFKSHFKALIDAYSENSVIDTTLGLNREGVFSSELKAKIFFPELFQPSPERSLQHEQSEREALASEADFCRQAEKELTTTINTKQNSSKKLSLFPVYLSYACQHSLLAYVQDLLEHCCYDFAKIQFPEMLKSRSWDCSQAVELTQWVHIMPENAPHLLVSDSSKLEEGKGLKKLLQQLVEIRHAAVHRLPLHIKKIEILLGEAAALALMLGNMETAIIFEGLSSGLSASMKDLELRKNEVESDLDRNLKDIEEQKHKLDVLREDLKVQAIEHDKAMTAQISNDFAQLVEDAKSEYKVIQGDTQQMRVDADCPDHD